MSRQIEALLGAHARRVLTHSQLVDALRLAGVRDPEAAITTPTLVDLPAAVYIRPSPMVAIRRRQQVVGDRTDPAGWGQGTQL